MIDNIDEIIEKYESYVIKKLDKDNMTKIVYYLINYGVNYIEDLFDGYLDLFLIPYEEFVNKFNLLNNKYNGNLINIISEDLSILEEMLY